MLDDEILQGFLDKVATRAMQEIRDKGKLSEENAIPLMLKSQFNHIAHLEIELSDIRRNMVTKDQFAELKDQFNFVKWIIMLGFSILATLQVYTAFIR